MSKLLVAIATLVSAMVSPLTSANGQSPTQCELEVSIDVNAKYELEIHLNPGSKVFDGGSASGMNKRSTWPELVYFNNMSSRATHASNSLSTMTALLVEPSGEDGLRVRVIESPRDPVLQKRTGLLIWSEGGREFWRDHDPSFDSSTADPRLASTSRSNAASSASTLAVGSSTNPLQQLASLSGSRGRGIGNEIYLGSEIVLNPQITIRRYATDDELLPQQDVAISSRGDEIFEVTIPADATRLKWEDFEDVPDQYEGGLLPGTYSLRVDGNDVLQFAVKDESERENTLPITSEVGELPPGLPKQLKTLLAVYELLDYRTAYGKPVPLLSDALNEIEKLSDDEVGPGLERIRSTLLAKLSATDPPPVDQYETGIKQVDEARRLLAAGNWSRAKEVLSAPATDDSDRSRGFRSLYRAVIAAQSGVASQDEANQLYIDSINLLADSEPIDSWRAYNNYGVFLLNNAQDSLNNHAFQIAAGGDRPLSKALLHWQDAKEAFDVAVFLASKVDEATAANVQINIARHSALMADILNTLDLSDDGKSEMRDRLASRVVKSASTTASSLLESKATDSLARGCAAEVLAQIAFRATDLSGASKHV